ncbi:zinc knuckle CX2CX4HX4C containing protein, partial [Tanacetum coccineum]
FSHDAVMLRIFPIILTRAAKRWVDKLPPGTINTWDMIKKAFIQRYCPPSKTTKQLEEIHNFKKESDETLYQAWERSNGRKVGNVGCKTCGGAHRNKECPLREDVKSVEEVKYGEFGRSFLNNNRNNARYRVGLPRSLAMPTTFELSPGSFTLSCIIGCLNIYAMTDLGDSVNIMPYSMFKCLKLTSLKETSMLVEMADMLKKVPMGTVENVLVKIDKFVFPYDFVIIDVLGDPNKTIILDRPFLATIHVRINVFRGEISLGIGEDRIMFDINGNVYHPTVLVEEVYMANFFQEEESFNPLEISDEDTMVSDNVQEKFKGRKEKTKMVKPGMTTFRLHYCKPIQELSNNTFKLWPTCGPSLNECNGGDTIYGLDEQGSH